MIVRLAHWWNSIGEYINKRALHNIEKRMAIAMVDKAQLTTDVQALVATNQALINEVATLRAAQDFTDIDNTVKAATEAGNAALTPPA